MSRRLPALELLQRPSRALWPPCWTASIANDSRTGSEKSFVLPPGAWLDFSPGPAVKSPLSYPRALGSIFLLPRPVSPACSVESTSLPLPPGLVSGPRVLQLKVSVTSSFVPSPASLQTTVTPYQAVLSTPRTMPAVQAFMQDWQDAFFRYMKNNMMDMLGAAPPQPSMGPTVPPRIMSPDELWQLSPSGY